jgi:hypothetical protein
MTTSMNIYLFGKTGFSLNGLLALMFYLLAYTASEFFTRFNVYRNWKKALDDILRKKVDFSYLAYLLIPCMMLLNLELGMKVYVDFIGTFFFMVLFVVYILCFCRKSDCFNLKAFLSGQLLCFFAISLVCWR